MPKTIGGVELKFRNFYRDCGQEWEDEWDSMCNDRCPVCNKEIEPYRSEDISRDESDYIDIIDGAKSAWFEGHPEIDVPTDENTDEFINVALGLNPSGSLRGLENDLAEMSDAEIAECVADGLDKWLVSMTNLPPESRS